MAVSIQSFFEHYASALMSYSAEEISACYQTPLAIYSDQGIRFVNQMPEIVSFWKEAVKPYAAQKIQKAIPEILSGEQLSKSIFVSKVRWNNVDASGAAVMTETNFYILSEKDNELKISGLIIMNK